jgi:hypothetical protein
MMKPTRTECADARLDLVRVGLVEYGGNFRDGAPVWRATELSKRATEVAEEGDDEAIAYLQAALAGELGNAIQLGALLARRLSVPWRGLTVSTPDMGP